MLGTIENNYVLYIRFKLSLVVLRLPTGKTSSITPISQLHPAAITAQWHFRAIGRQIIDVIERTQIS